MAINIKFDLVNNPEPPTIILATRNGNKLGLLDVNIESVNISDNFNDASEFTFTLNKYVDGELTNLWDKVVDFKLIYCKEWDMWFEINVELDEETETIKTVFCTQLGQAELSQIMLYNIEINTEEDIERDDYRVTVLYNESDPESSLLNRLLKDKAPHYSIIYVDSTINKIQRTFSFDDTSIYDAFQEISEEIGCLFVFHSNSDENGRIQRAISVYDLQQNCNDCGHRGEFTDKCPKCNSSNITNGYGEDTLIFVTSDELASSGIQLTTDTDSVKNYFKLEAGDDLMTATVRNCNPNGTDYICRFSDEIKKDMSDELVEKIESYDELYDYYMNDYTISFTDSTQLILLSEDVEKKFIVGQDVQVGDVLTFKYLNNDTSNPSIKYTTKNEFGMFGMSNQTSGYVYTDYKIGVDIIDITVNEDVTAYLKIEDIRLQYNKIVDKYKLYNEDLSEIPESIIGYSNLMNEYYNAIDLSLYLKSELMPSVEISETNASEQADLLTAKALSPVSVASINTVSLSTANSSVLSMAKIIVKPTYKVEINTSELSEDKLTWIGNFVITNYSDEEDTAISNTVSIEINDDEEAFIKQKLEKALNKENTDDLSITGLFEKEYNDFRAELKKYALNPLISFRDACQACIDILIEQGVGNGESWSESTEGADSNLYEKLYVPYYDKLMVIEGEIKIREDEVNVIIGTFDSDGVLQKDGIQTCLDKYKAEIQNAVDFKNYLGDDLWLELCSYRREDKYSNENYISDGLNNAELFKRALEFFEIANNEIYKSSELQHSISTTLNNLLAVEKFRPLVESFKVGNWIRVQVDEKIYKLRLLKYEIDYGNFSNISVEFSDVIKIKNGITDVKSILSQASSMATSYHSVQRQANQGEKSNTVLSNWISNGLKTTNTKIVGADNQNQVWDKNGILCRQYEPITDTYSDEQLKIINSTIAITDNNWETTKTAIGKYYHADPTTGESKTSYGVIGETIVGKMILGESLGLYNSDNSMSFDDNGFVVKNDINTFAINPNSDSLLTAYKNDTPTLSFDENGDLIIVGNITAKSLTLDSNVEIDIRDEEGNVVTDTYVKVNKKIGDAPSEDTTGVLIAENGTLTASNAIIYGTLYSSLGEIGGFTITSKSLYNGIDSIGAQVEEGTSGVYVGTDGIRIGDDLRLNANGSFVAGNRIYIRNGCGIRGVKSGDTSVTISNSNCIAYINTNDRVVLGHSNNSAPTVVSSPEELYLKSNGDTTDNGRHSVKIKKDITDGEERGYFMPAFNSTDAGVSYTSLGGTNHKWRNIYATNGTITTSDRNQKRNIQPLSDKYIEIFDMLEPVSYEMINGDRIHTGFIAQDVEKAMEKAGLTSKDFGGLCMDSKTIVDENNNATNVLDDDGNQVMTYSLRYSEFIALNTAKIKQLEQLVSQLQNEIELLKS